MNIRRLCIPVALLCALAFAAGFMLPGTTAYLWAESDVLTNTFTAPYIPPTEAQVEVTVHKTVRNTGMNRIGPGGFRFRLENTDTLETSILTTDDTGTATLMLSFADVDLGKEHRYTLSEINDGRSGMTYSEAVYDIAVTLQLDEETNIIHASVTLNGMPVEQVQAQFVNIFHEGTIVPLTGDDTPLLLCAALMLLSGTGMIVLMAKRRSRC